ncbi:hypothetical protein PPERSA_01417 [Pseudocohnilembus persalinus]|uniref:E2F/DP family winged-helix DNA-binding domain-containing protein n=1 Tax=Pseudocohnilembus persalinus TaxID=266149 RepID=A0A0V0QH89_PSEPJ|nr:hypothetical protein PPERSA_01417 [Pseudocohnilembus persalinus]|eukprot:KRX01514.1 hypothetical protein PPERSA_01417 [Pseudocohnilembus persalinus]
MLMSKEMTYFQQNNKNNLKSSHPIKKSFENHKPDSQDSCENSGNQFETKGKKTPSSTKSVPLKQEEFQSSFLQGQKMDLDSKKQSMLFENNYFHNFQQSSVLQNQFQIENDETKNLFNNSILQENPQFSGTFNIQNSFNLPLNNDKIDKFSLNQFSINNNSNNINNKDYTNNSNNNIIEIEENLFGLEPINIFFDEPQPNSYSGFNEKFKQNGNFQNFIKNQNIQKHKKFGQYLTNPINQNSNTSFVKLENSNDFRSEAYSDQDRTQGESGRNISRGLRKLSLKVKQIVQEKKKTSYKDVAETLVKQMKELYNGHLSEKEQQKDEQNIKRRVYDALNVLIAANVIQKHGKVVSSIENTNLSGKCLNRDDWTKRKDIEKNLEDKKKKVVQQEKVVKEQANQLLALKYLQERNQKNEEFIQNKRHMDKIQSQESINKFFKSQDGNRISNTQNSLNQNYQQFQTSQQMINFSNTQNAQYINSQFKTPCSPFNSQFNNVLDQSPLKIKSNSSKETKEIQNEEVDKNHKFHFPVIAVRFKSNDQSDILLQILYRIQSRNKVMEKLKNFIEKNKKEVGLVALGTALTGALLYITLKGEKKTNTVQDNQQATPQQQSLQQQQQQQQQPLQTQQPQQQQAQNIQIQSQTQPQDKQSLLQEIVKKINVKFIGQTSTLDLETITQVLEQSIDLATQPYIDLTVSNRQKRREVMRSDITKYEGYIMEYNEQVEKVLIAAQEELLEALEIEKEQFEESVLVLMERGLYQQMYMLQAAIRQKIKEKIPAKNEVSMDKTKEVIQYQVQVLKDKPEFFKNIIKKLQGNMETANLIPMVLNTMLQDLIHEKFNIEEEDQMKNMMGHQILNDPEIHQLLMEIEEAMFNLMGSMGMGDPSQQQDMY